MVDNGGRKGGKQGIDGLPKRMLGRLLDVKVWRGGPRWKSELKLIIMWRGEGGILDHFLMKTWLKLVGGWRSAGRMESVRNVLKVSELNNRVKGHTRRACVENVKCGEVGRSRVWRRSGKSSECTNDVCGMRRVGGQRRKSSEWWNEVGRAVAEKRRAFEEWLQRRDR